MKKVLWIILLILIIAGCKNITIIRMECDKKYNVKTDMEIFLNNEIIGKVLKIESKENYDIAICAIKNEYAKEMTNRVSFYYNNTNKKKPKIIAIKSDKGEKIQNNDYFVLKSQKEYYIRKTSNNVMKYIKSFLGSEKVKKIKEKIEETIEKNIDKEKVKELNKKIEDFLLELQNKYGEELKDIEKQLPSLIDSFIKDLEKQKE